MSTATGTTLTPEQCVTELRTAVNSLSRLLEAIPTAILQNALKDEMSTSVQEEISNRRDRWSSMFMDMKKDLEQHQGFLKQMSYDCEAGIRFAKTGIQVFNGAEFKESLENMQKFISLSKEFMALRDNGFLSAVIDTANKA